MKVGKTTKKLPRDWGIALKAASILLLVYYGPVLLFSVSVWLASSLSESVSPSKLGSAVFFHHSGLMSNSKLFCVRDYQKADSLPIRIGWASYKDFDNDLTLHDASWSGDGSVVAVRATSMFCADIDRPPPKVLDFTSAYDFRNHQIVTSPKQIQQLMARRSGGKTATKLNLAGRRTWWWEYNYFKNIGRQLMFQNPKLS